jgi:hypothetical protein
MLAATNKRYRYAVHVIEGQVVGGKKTESVVFTAYTTAASEKQAINNVKHRNEIQTGMFEINGFGDYGYTTLIAERKN